MLSWALRYLAVAVLVAGGFAMLQDSGLLKRALDRPAASSIAGNQRPAMSRAAANEDGWQYVVEAGPHGHFVVEAVVNGEPVTFLIDTGASEIVLNPADARRLGFHPARLEYSQRFQSANGVVRGAPVRLRELRIGQFSLYDLQASVNEAPLAISLLGMGFLERLEGYEVQNGRLILRW